MGGWSSKEHFVEEGDGTLSLKLAHQDLTTFPEAALAVNDVLAARVVKIDITGNKISDLAFLHRFPNATDLYADENRVSHSTDFPPHAKLRGLSLNKNCIGSGGKGGTVAVERIAKAYPNLAFLSLLHNPGCPSYFIGASMEDSEVFRMFCVSRLRQLRFLDSAPVTLEERSEADSELGTSFVAARTIVSSSSAAAAGAASTPPRASNANLSSAKLHASSRDTVASFASTTASVRPKKEKKEKKEKEAPAEKVAAEKAVVAEAYGGTKETLTCHRCTAKLVLESSMLNTQRCPSCAAPLMAPVPTLPPSLPPPPPPQAQ